MTEFLFWSSVCFIPTQMFVERVSGVVRFAEIRKENNVISGEL